MWLILVVPSGVDSWNGTPIWWELHLLFWRYGFYVIWDSGAHIVLSFRTRDNYFIGKLWINLTWIGWNWTIGKEREERWKAVFAENAKVEVCVVTIIVVVAKLHHLRRSLWVQGTHKLQVLRCSSTFGAQHLIIKLAITIGALHLRCLTPNDINNCCRLDLGNMGH